MKKNTYRVAAALLALLLLLGLLSGCSQDESLETAGDAELETEDEEDIDYIPYENEEMGILLKLPLSWDEDDYEISYDRRSDVLSIDTSYGGNLADIRREIGELIDDIEDITLVNAGLLGASDGWTYYWTRPGDVQWSSDEEEAVYVTLYESLDDILNSIQFIGAEPPKARTDGFKVAGTNYFNAEIPEEWELVVADEDYRWNLLDKKGDTLGYFQMMPYASGYDGYSKTEVDGQEAWVNYIPDDDARRTVGLTLFLKQNASGIGLSISDTLELTGGAHNYIDVETSARIYRSGGAETITAEILSMEEDEDGNTIIAIEEVDESLTPTGFRMKLTVGSGTAVVPARSADTVIASGSDFYRDYQKKVSNGLVFEITHYEGEAKTMFGVSLK